MSLCKVASLFHLRLHQLHVFLRVMLGVTFKGELLSFVHRTIVTSLRRDPTLNKEVSMYRSLPLVNVVCV